MKDKFQINVANANHKAEMTIQFLKNFDAFGILKFSEAYHFNIPHVTCIHLDEKSKFWTVTENYIETLKRFNS